MFRLVQKARQHGLLPRGGAAVALFFAGFGVLSAASFAAGVPGAAVSSASPADRNGPGSVATAGAASGSLPQQLSLGSLSASSPASCVLAYSVQVLTDSAPGTDTFELQIFDDGAIAQTQTLSAPADGAVHHLQGTVTIAHPISQSTSGVGVYLVDDGAILDFADPVGIICGAVDIPTLDALGTSVLAGALLLSALVLMRRRRNA
ncbi:MAG: hypothetical protein ABI639_00025 [Thermoanaerobaculia bacterium]